jgi:dihydrofolate reductase
LQAAIDDCQDDEEAFVIGGATLYAEALPLADRLYVTEVDASPEGDTLFPPIDRNLWIEAARRRMDSDEKNAHAMEFVVLQRT